MIMSVIIVRGLFTAGFDPLGRGRQGKGVRAAFLKIGHSIVMIPFIDFIELGEWSVKEVEHRFVMT